MSTVARNSNIKAMQKFALGIETEKAAVVDVLTHDRSNSQVEGQVNRLTIR